MSGFGIKNPFIGRASVGPSGPPGPAGPQGDEGPTGNTGTQGDQGIQGIQGIQGVQGDKGDTGSTGATGAAGAAGSPGTNGTNGTNGTAATITVGTTTTGAPGSSASVTNVGTTSAAVFNFTVPQGPSGISKRIVTLSGTTDGSGLVTFTFSPAFAAVPHVSAAMQGAIFEFTRISALSASSCTIHAYLPNTLTVLGLSVLGLGTTNLTGRTVKLCATEI